MWSSLRRYANKLKGVWMRKTTPTGGHDQGLPDVIYSVDGTMGLLELKYHKAWPKRPTTKIKTKLKPTQRATLAALHAAGANAHVLMGIGDEWWLMDWPIPTHLSQRELQEEPNWGVKGCIVAKGSNWSQLIFNLGMEP